MAEEKVATLQQLPPGKAMRVVIGATAVALARASDGSVHALADLCSHDDVSLSEGDVSGGRIECWGHGSEFDLCTGKPAQLPATDPVAVYGCRVDGEDIFVDTDQVLNA